MNLQNEDHYHQTIQIHYLDFLISKSPCLKFGYFLSSLINWTLTKWYDGIVLVFAIKKKEPSAHNLQVYIYLCCMIFLKLLRNWEHECLFSSLGSLMCSHLLDLPRSAYPNLRYSSKLRKPYFHFKFLSITY